MAVERNNPNSTNLFDEKWSANRIVGTDYRETRFEDRQLSFDLDRGVPQKYTYYYHTLEINRIVDNWVRSHPSDIKLTHQSIPLPGSCDLLKIVDRSIAKEIGQVHHLTITGTGDNPKRKTALLVAGTHAREVASVTSLIAYVDQLLFRDSELNQQILHDWIIHVVPLLNPLGYYIDNNRTVRDARGEIHNSPGIYHRKNDRGIRRLNLGQRPREVNWGNDEPSGDCGAHVRSQTRRLFGFGEIGVDLNRNSGKDFRFRGKTANGWQSTGRGETYPGPSQNSEPEIKAFQQLFGKIEPNLFITIHGYGNMIVTSDVYDDRAAMSGQERLQMSVKGITMDPGSSVPSAYLLSDLVADSPFYKSLNDPISETDRRITGERIEFPLKVSPLGTATGDMTYWSYVAKKASKNKAPYCGFTLELGSSTSDRFYPNRYQMIDIVYNAWTVITNSFNNFESVSTRL
jgi:hypothetical protein